MGVKPKSPSANFTTYRLPTPRQKGEDDAFGLPRPKALSNGLIRFLFCSRPCFHGHPVDRKGENPHVAEVDEENGDYGDYGDSDWTFRLKLQLQAVMRHLEVRWQLFDEALSRFGDLEAMLAICTERAMMRHHTTNGTKDVRVVEELRSLIARKLSMEVSIQRITQLSSFGELGAYLDQDGHLGQQQLPSQDRMQMRSDLELLYESSEEVGRQFSRPCVLEEDTYILCNRTGEVVEEGKQVVLWEQYNATWYIRGCVSYPATPKSHA